MPETGENVAEEFQVTRADQDAFALRSQQRAEKAKASGYFAKEIVAVEVPGGKAGPIKVDKDEHPRPETTLEQLAKLKTPFRNPGTVTAGNASGVNDGAAAIIVASEAALKAHGLKPRARILGMASAAVPPRIMLDGVAIYELDHGIQFQGVQTKPRSIKVTGKIGFSNHPMLEHFKFLKAHTRVTPKMTIPAPTVMHFRLEPGAVAKEAYANRDAIFDDLAVAYQNAIKAFYAAGCRYLQFDDTAWAYLCSQEELKKARERGLDVDHLQETYTRCINKALEAKPADMRRALPADCGVWVPGLADARPG